MKLEKMIHSEEQERGVEAIVGGTKDQSSLLQQQLRLLGKTLWQEIEIEGENKSEPHKRLGGETAFPYNQQLWRREQRVERRRGKRRKSMLNKNGMGHLRFTYFVFVCTVQLDVFIFVPFEIWSNGIVPDHIAFVLRRVL